MEEINRPNGYWTKERCLEEAKKYESKSEWLKKSVSSYGSAHKNGWLVECSSHMTPKFKKHTKES
jgi:hypothetical protein